MKLIKTAMDFINGGRIALKMKNRFEKVLARGPRKIEVNNGQVIFKKSFSIS